MIEHVRDAKYIKIKNDDYATHLKIHVAYSLGGHNPWNNQAQRRGYYLHITPVKKSGMVESTMLYSGVKKLVKEVKRKSKGAEQAAIDTANIEAKAIILSYTEQENIEINKAELNTLWED